MEYVAFVYCSGRLIYPRQSFQSGVQNKSTNCLQRRFFREKKKINSEEDEKIYFDPKIICPRKSYGRHFEIIIEL
jgi:hypothetical protein